MKRLKKTINNIWSNYYVDKNFRVIVYLLKNGQSYWEIADHLNQIKNTNYTPNDVKSFIKVHEEFGIDNFKHYVISEIIRYICIKFYCIVCLFKKDIVSMDKYSDIIDEIISINKVLDVKINGDELYEMLVINDSRLFVTNKEYFHAVDKLQQLKKNIS